MINRTLCNSSFMNWKPIKKEIVGKFEKKKLLKNETEEVNKPNE